MELTGHGSTKDVTNHCFDVNHEEGVHMHGWARYYRGPFVTAVPLQPGQDGPDCIWDNTPTRRAGACWTCPVCGTSTSC